MTSTKQAERELLLYERHSDLAREALNEIDRALHQNLARECLSRAAHLDPAAVAQASAKSMAMAKVG
jgi:hypothetical protein